MTTTIVGTPDPKDHPETSLPSMPRLRPSRGSNLPASHTLIDAQHPHAGRDRATTDTHSCVDTQSVNGVGGPIVGSSHVDYVNDQHTVAAADSTSPPTTNRSSPMDSMSAGNQTTEDNPCCDTQAHPVLGPNVSSDHGMFDSHRCPAAADQTTPPSQPRSGPQTSSAGRGAILR